MSERKGCKTVTERPEVWYTPTPRSGLYGMRDLIVDSFPFSCHEDTAKGPTSLDVCCYGIDLGASIVRFNQSEHGISTNESAPLCH